MKKSLSLLTLLVIFCFNIQAQSPVRFTTHSGYTLSWGNFERNGERIKDITRFTVVINAGFDAHLLESEHVGLSIGLETRNLGTILEDTLNAYQDVRTKHRVYTIGAPVTLMLGNIEKKAFFFLGGEYEYTFDYKEKVFVDGDKQYKSKGDYNYNVRRWLPSAFVGAQAPNGTYIKFQFYLQDFFEDKYQFTYRQGTTLVYPPFSKSQLMLFELGHRAYFDKPAPAKSQQTRARLRSQMAMMD